MWQIWAPSIQTTPTQIWGSNLFNKGRIIESYLAKAKFMFNQVQNVQEQGPKCKGWLTFLLETQIEPYGFKIVFKPGFVFRIT